MPEGHTSPLLANIPRFERLPLSIDDALPFKISSGFEPAGDQPAAIRELVDGLAGKEQDQVLLGVTGSGKTFTSRALHSRSYSARRLCWRRTRRLPHSFMRK